MTFVRTKLKLAQMVSGDVLEVFLQDGEPLENIPLSAREQGYEVISVEHVQGSVHKVVIKK